MLILRGIHFDPVFQASGATNFYGQGWWYHKLLAPFGLRFTHTTFVSKTTTLLPRAGNMKLKADGVTPKEWFPKCVYVDRNRRLALNAVGLSGPGMQSLLESGKWQKQTRPFFISIMSLEKTPRDRLAEVREMCEMLTHVYNARTLVGCFGIQVNCSCPNGGLDPNALVDEVIPVLEMMEYVLPPQIPVMPKFGPEVRPSSLARIAKHRRCYAVCAFNTLPFGKHPVWATRTSPINWKVLFGTDDPHESPIAKRFPGFAGGLSGAPLLPFLIEWLEQVHALGISIPINAGGGILSGNDAGHVLDAGADSIFLGSIAMLAPTQVQKTIQFAHRYARLQQRRPTLNPREMTYNV